MNKKIMVIMLIMCGLISQAVYSDAWKDMAKYKFGDELNPVKDIEKLLQDTPVEKYGRLEKHLIDIVTSKDATQTAKGFACRFLQRVGSKRCIPEVSALLCDEILSHYARLVLERLKCEEADNAMRDALEKAPDNIKVGLLGSLGERRDKKTVKIACRLTQSKDIAVVKAAMQALGKIGGEHAAGCLSKLDTNDKLKSVQMESMVACTRTLSGHAATSLLEKVFKGGNNSCRIAALKELIRVDLSNALPLLVKAIKGGQSQFSKGAFSLVASTKGKQLTSAMIGLLEKLPPGKKGKLIVALGLRGDKSASRTIIQYLKSENSSIRTAAATAVSKLASTDTVQILLGMANSPAIGDTVAAAISNMEGEGIDKELIKALDNPTLRTAALKTIMARGSTMAVPHLVELVKDKDADVRAEAWSALTTLAREDNIDSIVKAALKIKDEKELGLAAETIKQVCSRAGDKSKCFKVVAGSYKNAPVAMKKILLELGATIGDANGLKLEQTALASDNKNLYETALHALSQWPNKAAAVDLLKQAKEAPEKADRITALQGYIRIAGLDGAGLTGSERTKMFKIAMKLSSRIDEKKQIISGLRNAVSLEALEMLKKFMKDPELKAAAEVSAAFLAWNIRTAFPTEAEAMAKKLRNSRQQAAFKKAMQTLSDLRKTRSYVRGWLISRLYKGNDFAKLFNTSFPPEKNGRDSNWKNLLKGIEPETINLEKATNQSARSCVYLKTTLISPKEQKVRLELGSDDGIKAWLNGKLVHENRSFRGCAPGQDVVKVKLIKGKNSLLLKIVNASGTWGASCRIRDADGMPIEGLEVRPGL